MDAIHTCAPHCNKTPHFKTRSTNQVTMANYDYNHEAYGHYTRRNGVDFREGSYKCLPDNGKQFMRDRMRGMGFKLFQDFTHKDGHETRWWFKDTKTWEARTPGIEKLGYKATGALQVS